MQQFTREGNFLHLILNASPAGLIHKIICKFALIFEIKYDQRDSGLSTFFFFSAFGRTLLIISSIYYFFLNKLGTSPVFSMLFILSKNSSYNIWVSTKRKHNFYSSAPVIVAIFCKSPLNDSVLYPLPI